MAQIAVETAASAQAKADAAGAAARAAAVADIRAAANTFAQPQIASIYDAGGMKVNARAMAASPSAAGSGTSDDTITLANTFAFPKRGRTQTNTLPVLEIPDGWWRTTKPLVVQTECIIRGAGMFNSLIELDPSCFGPVLIGPAAGTVRVWLEDLSVRGRIPTGWPIVPGTRYSQVSSNSIPSTGFQQFAIVGNVLGNVAVGSYLVINRGLADEETVIVSSFPSANVLVAWFTQTHLTGFTVEDAAFHPLIDFSNVYLGTFRNVNVSYGPGWGMQVGRWPYGIGYSGGDRCDFENCWGIQNRVGGFLVQDMAYSFTDPKVEANGMSSYPTLHDPTKDWGVAIKVVQVPEKDYLSGFIRGLKAERQPVAVWLEGTRGMLLQGGFTHQGNVYFDRNTTRTKIEGFSFTQGARLIDGGYDNYIGPNDGDTFSAHPYAEGELLSKYLSPGYSSDPEFGKRSGGLVFENGASSAGTTFDHSNRGTVDQERSLGVRGFGTLNGDVYRDYPVVAGETIYVRTWWFVANFVASEVQFTVRDASSPTTILADSTALARPSILGNSQYRQIPWDCQIDVPAGVTSIRVMAKALSASVVYLGGIEVIPNALVNGGFDALNTAYASGLARGWTLLGGTATLEEETALAHLGVGSAQRIAVTGSNAVRLYNTPTLNPDSLYMFDGLVAVESGDPSKFQVGWGQDIASGIFQWKLSPKLGRRSDSSALRWESLRRIFKPSSDFSRLSVGVLGTPSGAASFLLDKFMLWELRSSRSSFIVQSPEFVLSAAGSTVHVHTPSVNRQVVRVWYSLTEATDGNAGVALRLGTRTDDSYFWNVTPPINSPLDFVAETANGPVNTDARAGKAILAKCIGGKTGTGKAVIYAELR